MPPSFQNEPQPALDAEAIAVAIDQAGGKGALNFAVEVVEETVSTNDLAMAAGRDGVAEGWTVFAESQSGGRGRRGDPWVSPARRDLLFSVLLRPQTSTSNWPRLPQLAAVALCRAIDHLGPALKIQAGIKWPNDIWFGEKKVAGLLVDTHLQKGNQFAVLGIGLNVNSDRFPGELSQTATSLRLASCDAGASFDRNRLAARLLLELASLYPHCLEDESFAEVGATLNSRSVLLGREVRVDFAGQRLSGEVVGFGDRGEMILSAANGERRVLHSADQVRLMAGGLAP